MNICKAEKKVKEKPVVTGYFPQQVVLNGKFLQFLANVNDGAASLVGQGL